ncbi:hypothetical protein N9878_02350 [bacterium]|nr:hypothetical protein [bacterium]
MSNNITGFTFDGVNVSFENAKKHDVVSINQGEEVIETTPSNMIELCIQYLALNDPDALK